MWVSSHRSLAQLQTGLAILGACVGLVQGAESVPPNTVTTFNTVCASCHEGECSRRLSLTSGYEAAAGHIRRYAGPQPDQSVEGLFDVLNYMKERCAYYPISADVPQDWIWAGRTLDAWFSAVGTAYFIPLGILAPGRYTAAMEFDREAPVRLQVVDEHFRFLVETTEVAGGGMRDVELAALEDGACYLRVYPEASAKLKRLSIKMLRP